MIVCLCGSFRFFDEIIETRELLSAFGIACFAPEPFDFRDKSSPCQFIEEWFRLTEGEKLEASRRAEVDFLGKLDQADLVYIVNPTGYIGMSVTFEIGYAFAQTKPIYTMEPISDDTIMSLTHGVLSSSTLASKILEMDKANSD